MISFPPNPTSGQIYSASNGVTYTWDGTKWVGTYAGSSGGGSSAASLVAGVVIFTASSTPPEGFLELNGQSVSKSTYPYLFAHYGYTYGGSGDSFNIPDYRGEFLRAWDHGRGIDVGRALASWQADEFKSHTHTQAGPYGNRYLQDSGGYGANAQQTGAAGGSETRPRNIALMACVSIGGASATTTAPIAFTFQDTIAANTKNYNVRLAAESAGWNQVDPLAATISINAGVVVGSVSTSQYAFDTGGVYPQGTTITVINNGYVVGHGGSAASSSAGVGLPGGPAVSIGYPTTFTNNGVIGGGGGGGGNGAAVVYAGVYASGGGGGGGAGSDPSTGGPYVGSQSGTYVQAAYGSPGTTTGGGVGGRGSAGTNGTGGVDIFATGGTGGTGGNLGLPGGTGAAGTASGSDTGGPVPPDVTIPASAGGAGGAALVGKTYTNNGVGISGSVYGSQY